MATEYFSARCAALLVAGGCATDPVGEDHTELAAHTPSDCVVADGDGFTLTRHDVEDLRRHYKPPLQIESATRLALDVWLAEWIATGEIGKASLPERIRHHNALSTRDLDDRIAALAHARDRLHVTEGPCWAPLADGRS